MKKVSIILPAYNAENTIANTIESIINQDYDNYELIIINDHSKDKTEEICKKYEKNNKTKIKFYNNLEDKKGVSSARNYAILKSDAEYIMFIDADDLYKKDMLSNMVKSMEENDLVICGYEKNNNRQVIEIHNLTKKHDAQTIEEIKESIEVLQKNELFNQLWNKIFKSEIIKENNIKFSEEVSLGEDYRFVLDYIECSTKIRFINEILYIYNSDESGLALKYDEKNIKVRLENAIYHRDFYIKKNLDTYYADKLIILTMFSAFALIEKNNNYDKAKKIIKQYICYEQEKNILYEIDNNNNSLKLKMFIKLLKFRKANLDYCLGKIYNSLKEYKNKVNNKKKNK